MAIYKPLYIGLGIARTKHWKSAFMLDPKNLHNSQTTKIYIHIGAVKSREQSR